MRKITLKAYAKLNLNLHILPQKLANGFYEVRFLNHQLALADTVILEKAKQGITLICDDPKLAGDEDNLAFRAAVKICEKLKISAGVNIYLKKKIPVTGGLGGGSADAAAVILGLNILWGLKLSSEQKLSFAKDLGMDVCYCVIGGTCLIEGGGEKVTKQKFSLPKLPIVLVSPPYQKPSTAWAYQSLKKENIGKNLDQLKKLIKAIRKRNVPDIASHLHNDFEESIFQEFPEAGQIKGKLIKTGAAGAVLAGSGLSVFGIYPDQKSASIAAKLLKVDYPSTFLTETI